MYTPIAVKAFRFFLRSRRCQKWVAASLLPLYGALNYPVLERTAEYVVMRVTVYSGNVYFVLAAATAVWAIFAVYHLQEWWMGSPQRRRYRTWRATRAARWRARPPRFAFLLEEVQTPPRVQIFPPSRKKEEVLVPAE